MISQFLKINNRKLKRNKLYFSIRFHLDIYGNVIRLKRINRSFKIIYFKFYKQLISKPLNIFFKLKVSVNIQNFSKRFRHVNFRRKFAFVSFYHNLRMNQIRKFFIQSKKLKGDLITNFMTKLESRLDMFIYRSFNMLTLPQIKQYIYHGKIFVNSKKITYTNFNLEQYDIISFFNFDNFSRFYSLVHFTLGRKNAKIFRNYALIYRLLLAKASKKDRKFLICKNPRYIEVFNPILISIFIHNSIEFKDVPYFFSVKPLDILSLF